MYSGDSHRQPLLAARHRKQQRSAPRSGRTTAALLALAVLAAVALLLYRWAPQQSQEAAGSEEEQRDSERELQLLHQQPSRRFCQLPPPLVCAHGGDSAAAPPNTAAAFAAALRGGARCVEVDVARTREGHLVVLHARELQHLLRLAGRAPAQQSPAQPPPQVGDLTWAEVQQLRWEGGEGVETVEAVVGLVQAHTEHITLDVKTHTQGGEDVEEDVMAQEVVNLVARTACRQCLVWAKSDLLVRLVKELDPSQAVGYVVLNETAAARAAGMHRLLRMPQAGVVALHFGMASPEVVQQAQAANRRVHAWTANTAGMMRAVLDAGVDAVVTNHPQKLAEALRSRLLRCQEDDHEGL